MKESGCMEKCTANEVEIRTRIGITKELVGKLKEILARKINIISD